MTTGIITTDTYLNHNTGQGHPERADRVTVIINHLKKEKSKDLIWKKTKKFDSKYLQFTHNKNYFILVRGRCVRAIFFLKVFLITTVLKVVRQR